MIGPTGVGKTYLVKLIADKIGVPFIKGDATKFSETGYVGGDVEDLVRGLVREATGDIALAEYGIIYVDEIDKIASAGSFVRAGRVAQRRAARAAEADGRHRRRSAHAARPRQPDGSGHRNPAHRQGRAQEGLHARTCCSSCRGAFGGPRGNHPPPPRQGHARLPAGDRHSRGRAGSAEARHHHRPHAVRLRIGIRGPSAGDRAAERT